MHRSTIPRAYVVIGLLGLFAAPGCAAPTPSHREYLFFPYPPARPRVQFLTWFSGADQVEPERTSIERFVFGEEPLVQRVIVKPYGVAARDGVAYVCDTKGIALCRLDFVNHTFSVLGVNGPGRLQKPINVTIDPLGYKFVADAFRKQIIVFGPDDRYVNAFFIPEPCHPVDVAVYGERLYVLDNDETCQIVVLDRITGEVVKTFGGPGGEPGQFRIPNSLCVTPDGCLLVSDTHNWRIQKMTLDGKSVWVKGTAGLTLGRFIRPRGIRAGPDGIVYVVDGATEIVQMFDEDGNLLMRFGGPGNMEGALGLPSQIAIDVTSIPFFQEYIHPDFKAEYLLFVVSQYGARLVNVYAFGSFPEGYVLPESMIEALPDIPPEQGVAPLPTDAAASQPGAATGPSEPQDGNDAQD